MNTPIAPLHNIRVLDLSRVIAGPMCSMMLADLGAAVIKVEPPGHGDDSRLQPPLAGGESHMFLSVNRNKKSIVVDLRTPEGMDIFWGLAAESDVLIENFRPGTMARLGIDYPTVAARHPQLVYCSISGYGQRGPRSQHGGYDPVLQAESGMMSVNGEITGGPTRHPMAIIDMTTALYANQAILAALLARSTTGRGQHIDVSLSDVALAAGLNLNQYYLVSKQNPPRLGNQHPTAVPLALFDTPTGPFYLALANDRLFQLLCDRVLGCPDLATDAKYATNTMRVTHRDDLMQQLNAIFAEQPREYWVDKCLDTGLPAGPVRTIEENLTSPEVQDGGKLATVDHPTAGPLQLINTPIHLSDTPSVEPVAPPLLGQHTDEVLETVLGYDREKIAQLRQGKVVG